MMSPLLHPEDTDRLIRDRHARLLPTLRPGRRALGLRAAIGRALIFAGTVVAGERATRRPPKIAHPSRSL